MNTTGDTKSILSQHKEEKEKLFKQEKNIYDIINSKELDLLYKKNAHLLARLSKTGKENTRLYTRLSSLAKEKSYLGDKNTVLKSKFLGLKEQISIFARQHREFNHQSHQLKKELEKAKKLPVQEKVEDLQHKELFKKQEKEIKLFKKKEQVYKKQIENLQGLYKREEVEKRTKLRALQNEHKRDTQGLEDNIQELCQALSKERSNRHSAHPSKLNKLKSVNQSLNKKFEDLKDKLKSINKTHNLALEEKKAVSLELNKLKDTIKKKKVELASRVKSLQEIQKENNNLKKEKEELVSFKRKSEDLQKNYETKVAKLTGLVKEKEKELVSRVKSLQEIQKENDSFKGKENKFNHMVENLEKEKQFIAEENQKIKASKKKIQETKKLREDLLGCKNQIVELTKQKEQLKSEFAGQLNLFIKERDILRFQSDNFKKALSSGKLGFDQAMLSFQKKYSRLYQDKKDLHENLEEKTNQITSLEEKILQTRKQLLQEKEMSENQIRREKEKRISELYGELKASKEFNQDMERQIHDLRTKEGALFLKEKERMREEIKTLKWNKNKNLLHIKESRTKEMAQLKQDYEGRIKNLEISFKNKLQHIRIEMENDLCGEKKRYEVFKNMKTQQIKELEKSLTLLQTESHEFKTQNFILKKSLEENQKNLDRYLKSSKKLEGQNENLRALWQNLQKQVETKDQQISSLQKLNRSLSLSLNQNKNRGNTSILKDKKPLPSDQISEVNEKLEDKLQQSSNQVLADIHFD